MKENKKINKEKNKWKLVSLGISIFIGLLLVYWRLVYSKYLSSYSKMKVYDLIFAVIVGIIVFIIGAIYRIRRNRRH